MENVVIYDIETMQELFLVVALIPGEPYRHWEVSTWKNEIDSFMKFVELHEDFYWVGYNNLRFDSQVLEFIFRNYQNWIDKSNLEICAIIAQIAQDTIHDANYDVFPQYREESLTCKQIDIFRINHYDNKNRMVSLKRLEFEMDMEDIEEMPIHHSKVGMTREDIVLTIKYCVHDVRATYEFFKITIGDTDHPLYKGNNQIQLRIDIEKEFDIKCMNFSDSKIGDEMIKKFYCEEKRVLLHELPKKGTFRKIIPVKACIAPYIEFKTPQLQKFLANLRKEVMKPKDEFKKKIKFYDNTYSFMRGGLHTENAPHVYEAGNGKLIIDWDVSSYYPAIIINNNKYPAHLGIAFLNGYKKMFERRLELKPMAKTDQRIKGIVGALKLAVNSVYGKSSDMQNWIYDRLLTMFTTITGELSLMMLIEAYELEGIHVISANTDGVTIEIDEKDVLKMHKINEWWMKLTNYELERTDYQKIIFSTVNDYIAIKVGYDQAQINEKESYIKRKGDFLTDFELHKNKSARIVSIALSNYYVSNISIADTIHNHKNIYDFALRQKASKDFHYEGVSDGKTTVYNKLIRYYISKTGEKLLKVKNPECTTNAAKVSQVEAGEWLATVCNKLSKKHPMNNINYNYYIQKANRIVDKIAYEGRKYKAKDLNQLTLF